MTNTIQQAIAETILSQLGGKKFIVMTGSKNFSSLNAQEAQPANIEHNLPMTTARIGGLVFKLGRFNGVKITHVRISLNVMDTYDVEFLQIRKFSVKCLKVVNDVYCDQLQEVFRDVTGLATSLGLMTR